MIALLRGFVSGNLGVSALVLTFGGLLAWRLRRPLGEQWRDPQPVWRILSRVALLGQPLLWLWVTFGDYWRQLLGLLMTEATAGYSDPYTVPPLLARHDVADPVRVVSLVLVAFGALGLAFLLVRSGLGPFPALAGLVICSLLYVVLSDARWRMELWATGGLQRLGQGSMSDLLVDAAFFCFLVTFTALVVLLLYGLLAGLVALPLFLVTGIVRSRRARPDSAYRDFTSVLKARAAAARGDDPPDSTRPPEPPFR